MNRSFPNKQRPLCMLVLSLLASLCLMALIVLSVCFERRILRAAAVERQLQLIGQALRVYSNGDRGDRYPDSNSVWRLTFPSVQEFAAALKPVGGGTGSITLDTYARKMAQVDFDLLTSEEFYYFGYLMISPEQYEAYFDCLKTAIHSGEMSLTEDIDLTNRDNQFGLNPIIECRVEPVLGVPRSLEAEQEREIGRRAFCLRTGFCHVPKVFRLREGIERFVIGDHSGPPCSRSCYIPVLIERPRRYAKGYGGHVLYLDGSVRFIEYPGDLPMTEAIWGRIDELEEQYLQ